MDFVAGAAGALGWPAGSERLMTGSIVVGCSGLACRSGWLLPALHGLPLP